MTFKLDRHSDLMYVWYKFMLILTDEENPINIFSVYNAPTLCTCNSEQLPWYLRFLQEHILSFHKVVLRCDTLDGYISIMDHVQNFYGEYELCFYCCWAPSGRTCHLIRQQVQKLWHRWIYQSEQNVWAIQYKKVKKMSKQYCSG